MRDDTYHLSGDVQAITMLIALVAVVLIVVGLLTLWREWRKQWDIEEFIDDFIPENADVLAEARDHPCRMPRWKGWRA